VASKSNALSENIEEREVSQPAALSEGLEGRGASDSAALNEGCETQPDCDLLEVVKENEPSESDALSGTCVEFPCVESL
jgi:hypothetical protein